jgi:hypothetical protein
MFNKHEISFFASISQGTHYYVAISCYYSILCFNMHWLLYDIVITR